MNMHLERKMVRWAVAAAAVLVVVGLGALPASEGSWAEQQQAPARVAYVNFRAALQQTPGWAAAESTFNAEFEGLRKDVQRLQAQYDSTFRAYQQQSIALSPSARQAKTDSIRQMQQLLAQRSDELQSKAGDRERELIGPLEERVRGVIEGLRAERNLAIVFDVGSPNNNIVAADRTLDLTAVVVQRLRSAQ